MGRLLGLLVAVVVLGAVLPAAARAEVVWLCHPSLPAADDPCQTPLDTTRIGLDGTRTVETPKRRPQAARPVDCFYVYPTVSNQLALNATQDKDPEVRAVARFQVSRYQTGCRMFAPVYRQVTVPGIVGNGVPAATEVAFADVREAWRRYLAEDNGGRGVILLGHSQGSLMLRQLIRTEIDPDPALRDRLVGAALLGGNVTTRSGEATGGDFQTVPTCGARGQFGCVVAYSTYQDDPPPGSFFGDTNFDPLATSFGFPRGPGYEIACTDPGELGGGAGEPVSLVVPTEPFPPGFISIAITGIANGPIPEADTTWVKGFSYSGGCRTINGANVFRYEPLGGSRRLQDSPPGGTHVVDFNLGTDQLVAIARRQTRGWLAAHLRLRARAGRIVARVPAAGRLRVSGPAVRTRAARAGGPGRVRIPVVARRATGQVRVRVRYVAAGVRPIVRSVRVQTLSPTSR